MSKTDNQNKVAEIPKPADTVESLKEEIKLFSEENTALKTELESISKNSKDFETKVSDLENQLESKSKSLKELSDINTKLAESIDSLKEENEKLRKMKSTTSKKIPAKFSWANQFAQEAAEKSEAEKKQA